MSLGEELEKLSNVDLKQGVLNQLEIILKSIAINHEGGCILNFYNIDLNIANDIVRKLKKENINIYGKVSLDKSDILLLMWNSKAFEDKIIKVPSPCDICTYIKCSKYSRRGCRKYKSYLKQLNNPNIIYISSDTVSVAINGNDVYIE